VVEDSTSLAHAAGGDDDGLVFTGVEVFGGLDGTDEGEAFEFKGAAVLVEEVGDFIVVALGVEAENFGGIDGEGAVNVNGDFGEALFFEELVEDVEEGLGALDGEGRDDDFSASFEGGVEDFSDAVVRFGAHLVLASAVGGFHEEVVDVFDRSRVVEDIVVTAADVS